MKNFLFLFVFLPSLVFAQTTWEKVDSGVWGIEMARASMPHGWLVRTACANGISTIFVPDEKHEWKL